MDISLYVVEDGGAYYLKLLAAHFKCENESGR